MSNTTAARAPTVLKPDEIKSHDRGGGARTNNFVGHLQLRHVFSRHDSFCISSSGELNRRGTGRNRLRENRHPVEYEKEYHNGERERDGDTCLGWFHMI